MNCGFIWAFRRLSSKRSGLCYSESGGIRLGHKKMRFKRREEERIPDSGKESPVYDSWDRMRLGFVRKISLCTVQYCGTVQ